MARPRPAAGLLLRVIGLLCVMSSALAWHGLDRGSASRHYVAPSRSSRHDARAPARPYWRPRGPRPLYASRADSDAALEVAARERTVKHGVTTPEQDAYMNPNVWNTFKTIEDQFYKRYPCPVKAFETLSFRFRRETDDHAVVLIRGIVTTMEDVEDYVHMEVWDMRRKRTYMLIHLATGMRPKAPLLDEVEEKIRPCPRKRRFEPGEFALKPVEGRSRRVRL